MNRCQSSALAIATTATLSLLAFAGPGGGSASAASPMVHGPQSQAPVAGAALSAVYPVHTGITATVFWVGEPAGPDNTFIDNIQSAWDDKWETHYGGYDDYSNRNGYLPAGFTPHENPFYFDLPYNDFPNSGVRKTAAASTVYWGNSKVWGSGESMLKNRWVKLMRNGVACYAQWEDSGPFQYDDAAYVFGTAQPKNTLANNAGMDVSPATRDCLGFNGLNNAANKLDWQFVDDQDVPPGPWTQIVTTSPTDWSGPPSLIPGSVQQTAPADLAAGVGTTPVLRWLPPANALTGTTRYTAEIWDGDAATGGRQLPSLGTTAFSLALPAAEGLSASHLYYWDVIACNGAICSLPGARYRFTTAAGGLVSPPGPTASPTPSPTASPSPSPTASPSPTPSPTVSPSPSPIVTPVPAKTATPGPTPPVPTPTGAARHPVSAQPFIVSPNVYTDALAPGWVNWSWNASVNFAATAPVYAGANAIAFSTSAAYGGIYLHNDAPLNTTGLNYLVFAARATQAGQRYGVVLEDVNNRHIGVELLLANYGGDPQPGGWTLYRIPLVAIGAADCEVGGVVIQDEAGVVEPVLYVDAIGFVP